MEEKIVNNEISSQTCIEEDFFSPDWDTFCQRIKNSQWKSYLQDSVLSENLSTVSNRYYKDFIQKIKNYKHTFYYKSLDEDHKKIINTENSSDQSKHPHDVNIMKTKSGLFKCFNELTSAKEPHLTKVQEGGNCVIKDDFALSKPIDPRLFNKAQKILTKNKLSELKLVKWNSKNFVNPYNSYVHKWDKTNYYSNAKSPHPDHTSKNNVKQRDISSGITTQASYDNVDIIAVCDMEISPISEFSSPDTPLANSSYLNFSPDLFNVEAKSSSHRFNSSSFNDTNLLLNQTIDDKFIPTSMLNHVSEPHNQLLTDSSSFKTCLNSVMSVPSLENSAYGCAMQLEKLSDANNIKLNKLFHQRYFNKSVPNRNDVIKSSPHDTKNNYGKCSLLKKAASIPAVPFNKSGAMNSPLHEPKSDYEKYSLSKKASILVVPSYKIHAIRDPSHGSNYHEKSSFSKINSSVLTVASEKIKSNKPFLLDFENLEVSVVRRRKLCHMNIDGFSNKKNSLKGKGGQDKKISKKNQIDKKRKTFYSNDLNKRSSNIKVSYCKIKKTNDAHQVYHKKGKKFLCIKKNKETSYHVPSTQATGRHKSTEFSHYFKLLHSKQLFKGKGKQDTMLVQNITKACFDPNSKMTYNHGRNIKTNIYKQHTCSKISHSSILKRRSHDSTKSDYLSIKNIKKKYIKITKSLNYQNSSQKVRTKMQSLKNIKFLNSETTPIKSNTFSQSIKKSKKEVSDLTGEKGNEQKQLISNLSDINEPSICATLNKKKISYKDYIRRNNKKVNTFEKYAVAVSSFTSSGSNKSELSKSAEYPIMNILKPMSHNSLHAKTQQLNKNNDVEKETTSLCSDFTHLISPKIVKEATKLDIVNSKNYQSDKVISSVPIKSNHFSALSNYKNLPNKTISTIQQSKGNLSASIQNTNCVKNKLKAASHHEVESKVISYDLLSDLNDHVQETDSSQSISSAVKDNSTFSDESPSKSQSQHNESIFVNTSLNGILCENLRDNSMKKDQFVDFTQTEHSITDKMQSNVAKQKFSSSKENSKLCLITSGNLLTEVNKAINQPDSPSFIDSIKETKSSNISSIKSDSSNLEYGQSSLNHNIQVQLSENSVSLTINETKITPKEKAIKSISDSEETILLCSAVESLLAPSLENCLSNISETLLDNMPIAVSVNTKSQSENINTCNKFQIMKQIVTKSPVHEKYMQLQNLKCSQSKWKVKNENQGTFKTITCSSVKNKSSCIVENSEEESYIKTPENKSKDINSKLNVFASKRMFCTNMCVDDALPDSSIVLDSNLNLSLHGQNSKFLKHITSDQENIVSSSVSNVSFHEYISHFDSDGINLNNITDSTDEPVDTLKIENDIDENFISSLRPSLNNLSDICDILPNISVTDIVEHAVLKDNEVQEAYNFLYKTLHNQRSLLKGFLIQASQPGIETRKELIEEIVNLTKSIKGYELACLLLINCK